MARLARINQNEELVLLALARLEEEGYGVTIQEEIEERGGSPVSLAAVYATLDRLEKQGYASSWQSDPTPERGGRAKRHFRLTPAGAQALLEAKEVRDRLWSGLDLSGLAAER